jgi:hypothetical protein
MTHMGVIDMSCPPALAALALFVIFVFACFTTASAIRDRHCRHDNVRGIYGDEINHVGGWRNQCLDCTRYLDGPVEPRGTGVRQQH